MKLLFAEARVRNYGGKEMETREGEVQDLLWKMERQEITSKEIVRELEERRLTERAVLKGGASLYLPWVILCFLPAIAQSSGFRTLNFLTQLPVIEVPTSVTYVAVVLFIAAIPLTVSGMYFNIKKGGCRSEDETIVLLRSGPYRIVRHPSNLAWSVFFVTIPIMLRGYVVFTILSVVGMVAMVALHYYASVKEERELDLRKWGDEYREYMKEVPRWNVLRGLWNLRS